MGARMLKAAIMSLWNQYYKNCTVFQFSGQLNELVFTFKTLNDMVASRDGYRPWELCSLNPQAEVHPNWTSFRAEYPCHFLGDIRCGFWCACINWKLCKHTSDTLGSLPVDTGMPGVVPDTTQKGQGHAGPNPPNWKSQGSVRGRLCSGTTGSGFQTGQSPIQTLVQVWVCAHS